MSFEKLVEKIIREGMERGEFEGLEGEGRPVDLSAYFAVPEELRAGFSLLRNADVVPEEVQLLRELSALKEDLAACEDEESRGRLRRSVNEKMLKYNLLRERQRRSSR